jgi:regulator of cell morphogenesis and NO signaling
MENNFPENQILQRYNFAVDKNILYSYEELKRIDIDQQFIYTLLQTFEDEKSFSEEEYNKFPLEIIIDYIHRTHRYYLTKKLFEIEQTINILVKDYSNNHPLLEVLNSFFKDYSISLKSHVQAEEQELLPYIKNLIRFKNDSNQTEEIIEALKNYSLQKFIDNHLDTEQDLTIVRDTILNYNAPKTNQTPYRILLSQLETFERDLLVHALIEDRVLIPRAQELEQEVNNLLQ